MDLKDQLTGLNEENSNSCGMKIKYKDIVSKTVIDLIKSEIIQEDVQKRLELQRRLGQLVTVVVTIVNNCKVRRY